MRIVVLVKQILDPEIPPQQFQLDPATHRPVQGSAKFVMDSYAENALEAAIQLRDRTPGSTVTALCLGDSAADEVLRRALSFTANGAVRVWDPALAEADAAGVAHVLAAAIRAIGGADLVLAGRQAGDVEEGLVGPLVAEELGVPCVTLVARIEPEGDRIRVTREVEDGFAVVSLPLPAVVTVTSSESNVPRLPKVKDVMLARGKPIKVLGLQDLGVDAGRLAPAVRLVRAWVPRTEFQCELVPGDDGEQKARGLVERLTAQKLV